MRQIRIVHSSLGSKTLTSEAQTWGQLKDSLGSSYGNFDKLNAVVKETRTALVMNDSVLPEGDFQIFLSPKQVKAGSINSSQVDILERLKEKLSNAIDELIEEIEEEEVNSSPKKTSSRDSDDSFFNRIKNLS